MRSVSYCACSGVEHTCVNCMLVRDVTIWADAILHIAFQCIAIYCHIAICG